MADRREFIKLDIGYLSNPKIAGLLLARRPLAVLLHVGCVTYARQHRTDGIVPAELALRSVIGATKRDLTAAIDAGLLIDHGDGTVEVHDYALHQETREEIEARSDAGRTAARARWGNAKRSANRSADGNANRIAIGNAEERRGEEKRTTRPSAAPPDTFDAWWSTYPRKEGKGQAVRAYKAAIKDVDPDELLRLTKQWVSDRADLERKFTPLPATWLNGQRWTDERPQAASGAQTRSPWDRAPRVVGGRIVEGGKP